MAFHSIQGWYFERMEDGGVRITKRDQRPDHRDEIVLGVELPADTWCSAVASVSFDGENIRTFEQAKGVHTAWGRADGGRRQPTMSSTCAYLVDRLHDETEPATWVVTPADWAPLRVCDAHVVAVMATWGTNTVTHLSDEEGRGASGVRTSGSLRANRTEVKK